PEGGMRQGMGRGGGGGRGGGRRGGMGGGRGGRGHWGGGRPEGGPSAEGGDEGSSGGAERGGFLMRLPPLITIEQSPELVTFRDSSGTALREIVTASNADSLPLPAEGVPRLVGKVKKNSIETERPAPMGGVITETYSPKPNDG